MYSQFRRHGTNQHCRNGDVSMCDKDLMNAFMSCYSPIFEDSNLFHQRHSASRRMMWQTDTHTHTHKICSARGPTRQEGVWSVVLSDRCFSIRSYSSID